MSWRIHMIICSTYHIWGIIVPWMHADTAVAGSDCSDGTLINHQWYIRTAPTILYITDGMNAQWIQICNGVNLPSGQVDAILVVPARCYDYSKSLTNSNIYLIFFWFCLRYFTIVLCLIVYFFYSFHVFVIYLDGIIVKLVDSAVFVSMIVT